MYNTESKAPHQSGNQPTAPSVEWTPPISFDTISTLPEFPLEALPPVLAEYARGLATATQTPPEMAATLELGALAIALQGRYTVMCNATSPEILALWMVVVAEPASRKSPVFKAVLAPLFDFQERRNAEQAQEISVQKAMLPSLKAQISVLLKEGKNEESKEIRDLTQKISNYEAQKPLRLIVSDVTPEQLGVIMKQQGGKMAIADTEGDIFGMMQGRYSAKTSYSIFLDSFSGDPVSVERIGRESVQIQNPRLSMLLTVQKIVIEDVLSDGLLRGRGMCGRMLFAICNPNWGHRDPNPPPIAPAVVENYHALMRRLLEGTEQGKIVLGDEAYSLRTQYAEEIEHKLAKEWAGMRDWGGKIVGTTMRIAALLHIASTETRAVDVPISADTVAKAIMISRFFSAHAEKVFRDYGGNKDLANAKYILARIVDVGKPSITQSEITRACRGRFKSVKEQYPAIDILCEMGYLHKICAAESADGRTTAYHVHPIVLTDGFKVM